MRKIVFVGLAAVALLLLIAIPPAVERASERGDDRPSTPGDGDRVGSEETVGLADARDVQPLRVRVPGDLRQPRYPPQVDDAQRVVPLNPVVDQICEPHMGGLNCKRVFQNGLHPFYKLDLEALADLAVTDAQAAMFYALRAVEPDLYLRAAALSGKAEPLMWYARGSSGSYLFGDWENGRAVMHFDEDRARRRAALEIVAEMLGESSARVPESIVVDDAVQKEVDTLLMELVKQERVIGSTVFFELKAARENP